MIRIKRRVAATLCAAGSIVAFSAPGASAVETDGEENYWGGTTTGCSARMHPVGDGEGATLTARVSAVEMRAKRQRFEGQFAVVRLIALDRVAPTPQNPKGWQREAISPRYVFNNGVARPSGDGFRSFFLHERDRNPRLSVTTPFGDDAHYLRVKTRFLDADGQLEDVDNTSAGLCAATS